jgi:hypothetical protein
MPIRGMIPVEQVFLLDEYTLSPWHWRVGLLGDKVLHIQKIPGQISKSLGCGILSKWRLAKRDIVAGVLSNIMREPGVPDYSKKFLIIVNERVFGDDFMLPIVNFKKKGIFSTREFCVRSKDGWCFQVRYTPPWIRELFRRFLFGSQTLEYDPVDFLEEFVNIIRSHRPSWVTEA